MKQKEKKIKMNNMEYSKPQLILLNGMESVLGAPASCVPTGSVASGGCNLGGTATGCGGGSIVG